MGVISIETANLAEKFAARRADIGLTQAEVARRAGVSRHLVSDIENGRCASISLGNIAKIAGQLGLTIQAVPGIPSRRTDPSPLPEDRHVQMLLDKYYGGLK